MKVNSYTLATLAMVAGAAATLGGCATDNNTASSSDGYSGSAPHAHPGAGYMSKKAMASNKMPAPEAAPAPAAAPSKAAAPAPKAAATSSTVMYIPTGDRASSSLMIEKIYPTQVTVGQPFDYVIKATDIGSAAINNVVITEAAPTNFTVTSTTPQGTNGTYNLGTLNPGESKTIVMKGSAAAVGSINSCASATYSIALCSTINVVQPALSITKEITPESILNCSPINMTVKVKNTGSGTASNVHVMDTLPAGLTLANGGTSFDEAVGDIAPGADKTITKELKAASVGSFENSASVKADGINPVSSNKVTTVVKQPKLEVSCKAGGKVLIGRNACYELTVKNTGNAVSNDTKIVATIPAGSTVVSSDGGVAGTGNVTFNVGALAAGASKTVNLCIKSAAASSLGVQTSATGACCTPASTTCSIDVIGVPDIGTQLSDDNGVVDIGQTHTFRYEVKNQGWVDLTNVTMSFTLDDGLDFVSTDAAGGAQGSGRTYTIKVGTLKTGDMRKINIVCKGSKEGELVIQSTTTADQTKPVRNDEQVNYIK